VLLCSWTARIALSRLTRHARLNMWSEHALAQRQPPTLPSSHLRFLSARRNAVFLFSLTRRTNSPISRSDAMPPSSNQLSSSPLTSCSCSCTLALSLWYRAIGLNDWSASSVSESFERCCCSKARNESRRDCDFSRCWFNRASSCRRESASARLLSINGCRGSSEAGIAGCVVFGLLRRADCRSLSSSNRWRSEVFFSFSVSGSQLCSMMGMGGCDDRCV
jgi:hypothetical protein